MIASSLKFACAPKSCFWTTTRCQARLSSSSSVKRLQAAFRDPSSPYYIAPGTQGPASPDEKPVEDVQDDLTTLLEKGQTEMARAGFHLPFVWQQVVEWGDHDSFQHVNNVRYVRYFENSRIHWMTCLGNRLGGPAKADAFLKGKGISLIMKSIEVKYRRPVTFPDTLLISHRPTKPPNNVDPAAVRLASSAYSVRQQAFVAHCNETVVWYDYDNLRKCFPGQEYIDAMWEHFSEN